MPRHFFADVKSVILDQSVRLALLIAAFSASVILPSTASGAVSVVVHDNTVTHTVRQDYTGTNFEAWWNSMGPDAVTLNDLRASKFGMIRFPGGYPADEYNWQTPGAGNWSLLDAKQILQASGSKLMYQTSICDKHGTGENSAATVQAIDAYAKANGIDVGMWEGGNEPEYGPHAGLGQAAYMAEYNTVFGTQFAALKAVSPSIPMIGPASTSLGNLALFLQAHGNKNGDGKVDGVSMHWYAGGGFDMQVGPNFGMQYYRRDAAQTDLANFVAAIKSTIATYDTRTLPIYITEWNWVTAGGKGDYDFTFIGINDADIVGMMLQLGVAGNTQFDLQTIAQSYGMIANWDNYRAPHRGDVNSVFNALTLAQKLGTSVLDVTNPADAGTSLSAYATKTVDGKIQVMLCNKDPYASQDVTVSFSTYNPSGRSVEISEIHNTNSVFAQNATIMNGVLFPQPKSTGAFPAPMTTTVSGTTYTVNLPANGSMAVLIFGGAGGTTSGTGTTGTTTGTGTTGTTTGTGSTGTGTGTTTGTTGVGTTGTTTGATGTGTTTGSTGTGTTGSNTTGSTGTGTTGTGSSTTGTSTGTTTATSTTAPEGGSPHTGCGTGGLAAMFTTLALLRLVGARRRDLPR